MAHPTRAISRHRAVQRGFTLAECLIASVVLALAVLGISGAMTASSTQSNLMDVDARSLSLAQALLERIAALPFDEPAGAPQSFDSLDDYDGYQDVFAPSTASNAPLSRLLEYRRVAAIVHRENPSGSAQANGDLALITVTVTPSAIGQPMTLHRLVSRYTLTRQ